MKLLFTTCFLVLLMVRAYSQTDVSNSKDYPLLDRLPNFSIIKYTEDEFGSHKFYYDKTYHMHEGRKFTIQYRHNSWKESTYKFPTRLQILRNYSKAIEDAGGRILFERYNSEHGYYSFESRNGQVIWVQVKVSSGKSYTLMVIEEENMRQDISIDEELIKNALEIEGKIAVYGIYFDTGKSDIKENSEPAMIEIAKFLKNNPAINCWVVGHTDSEGSFQINSKLSLDRAQAVKVNLIQKYGIAEDRLFAEGVGPLSPVASNTTEEGKKLNRRVELVKK